MIKHKGDAEPIRILYVENGIGYGGAVICLRQLVRNLDRSCFEPMVVTGRGDPQYEEIAKEAQWKHIPDRRIDIVAMKRSLNKARWIQRTPGLHFIINQFLARLDDVGNFLPHFLQLLWTAARFQPSLIHTNNEPLSNRAAILVGKVLQIPVVCHVRGGIGSNHGKSRLISWLYRLPDHFIPVSHWISKCIDELGIPAERRTVAYDGIPLDNLDIGSDGANFREAHGIPEDVFAVGLIGLLIPWKGQGLFLQAARELADDIPNLRMLIIGGTPDEYISYERELRERVTIDGLADIVQFIGHISKMEDVYNGLDVVVSASTSPEPFGLVCIETMAMAKPLVAPAHGGAAELTDNRVNALLFEPGNAHDLADSIRTLYKDPSLCRSMGIRAREKALNLFNEKRYVEHIQSIYRQVLNS